MSWVFLTRSGSERDLADELGEDAEVMEEGVVASPVRRRRPDATYDELAFARQAMSLESAVEGGGPEEIADALAAAVRGRLPKKGEPWRWTLQIVAADGKDPHDPRRSLAGALAEVLPEALRDRLSPQVRDREVGAEEAERLVQVWIPSEDVALVGLTVATEALSRDAGGKPRLRRPEDAVSRAGLKLEEAILWLGVGPEKGDRCVDLGAAPGGWTQVACGRGAHVIAIDPAKMKVDLPPKRMTHLQQSAFDYVPDETLDWLLCDMAWRPLEVAKLMAKWGRRGWARQAIVNFKLPMKKKAEMVRRILSVLEEAGWQGLRRRQLFHDRDEITLAAWLDPRIVARGAQPAFQVRAKARHLEAEASAGPRARGRKPRGGRGRGRATGRRSRGPGRGGR
ncbi:MAG: 23S rRNA (cytidine(2498)-2'-O)-methyltransferase RlmM [Myxococcota bacterium]